VQTDRTIAKDKPDIIIRDNGKGTCMMTGVTVSGNKSVINT
jgi:hypothetical protein